MRREEMKGNRSCCQALCTGGDWMGRNLRDVDSVQQDQVDDEEYTVILVLLEDSKDRHE